MPSKGCIPERQLQKLQALELDKLSLEERIKALRNWRGELSHAFRKSKLQAVIYLRSKNFVENYKDKKGNLNPMEGLQALVYRDRNERSRIFGGKGFGADLDSHIQSVRSTYHRKLYEMMEELRTTWLGFGTRKKANEQLVRAVFGESTDPRFKRMAKSWKDVVEELRDRFNKAGGDIKLLKDWNFPRTEDLAKIERLGEDKWIQMIKDTANLERMGLTDDTVDGVLSEIYHRIISDGLTGEIPAPKGTVGMIANRHQEARFIHFNDADSWLKYHEAYGKGNPFNAMMDYVAMVSNEIGLMEILGPNPHMTYESLTRLVTNDGQGITDASRHAFMNLSGQTSPVHATGARVMEFIRNMTTGAKLTFAVLSAPGDIIFNNIAARYNGISGFKNVMDVVKMLALANTKAARRLAADLGMQLDFMIDAAHSAHRYIDVGNQGLDAKFAGLTIKGSGLNHWTIANKMAFYFGFMQELGRGNIKKNTQLMKSFERYGIDEKAIDEIIASKKLSRNGSTFLDPKNVSQETAEAVSAMITAEMRLAVPEADVRAKSFMNRGMAKGTIGGEGLRLGGMFKTFSVSLMLGNWARVRLGTAQSGGKRAAMAAEMIIGTTILGVLSTQLSEISRRSTPDEWYEEGLPYDWGSKQLWADGFARGAGFVIIGDVLTADARKYGSVQDAALGPAAALFDDIFWKGALGTFDDAMDADKRMQDVIKDAGKTFVGLGIQFIPGQFFYSKTIMDELMIDSLRRFSDPRYDIKSSRRRAKKAEKYREKWW